MRTIPRRLLAAVTGGTMQWDPNLLATAGAIGSRKRPPPGPSPEIMHAVRSFGEAFSGIAAAGQQARQQSAQTAMQMMQQMMGG